MRCFGMCFRTGHCVPGVAIAVRSGDRNVVTSQQNYGMDIPGNVLNERMAAFMHMYTGDDPMSMASFTFLFAHFDSALWRHGSVLERSPIRLLCVDGSAHPRRLRAVLPHSGRLFVREFGLGEDTTAITSV